MRATCRWIGKEGEGKPRNELCPAGVFLDRATYRIDGYCPVIDRLRCYGIAVPGDSINATNVRQCDNAFNKTASIEGFKFGGFQVCSYSAFHGTHRVCLSPLAQEVEGQSLIRFLLYRKHRSFVIPS